MSLNMPKLALADNPQVVLSGSNRPGNFDCYSVAFASLFQENGEYFMYYTGAVDKHWSYASIGVALSRDLSEFNREGSSIMGNQEDSEFSYEAVTPAVTKLNSNYYMIFAGRKHRYDHRSLGIAWSDDPLGPFNIIGTLYKPSMSLEGYSIDNGPTLIKLQKDELLVYYSNCAPTLKSILLRRPLIRKIWLLKIKIRGTTMNSIEILQRRKTIQLNGSFGCWNESVFCPSYLSYRGRGILFFASSTYSLKPTPQFIGYAVVDSPYVMRIISRPSVLFSAEDMQDFAIHATKVIGFDSPCPIMCKSEKIILLYFILDRENNRWAILKSTLHVT